ncbi:winged helix-turn-helix transcriptional regulator [Symmachiella dynata]|uniref:winged helix-turn-helix transcriptional regulator n=1 Tax=Symmachiella dynata TaxID=2527995 RepID=UPI0030ED07E5
MKALLIYPTHDNCDEVVEPYLESGVDAACFPQRVTCDSGDRPQNCWNDDASQAEGIGLSVVKTVCPACDYRDKCRQTGYLAQLVNVAHADVAIATHKRAEYTGLSEMAQGRDYVSIHEDVIDLLRPPTDISTGDVVQARLLVQDYILNDPASLNWFGDATRVDDDGNFYQDAELAIRRERIYEFFRLLSELLENLHCAIESAERTVDWMPPATATVPTGFERALFFGIRRARIRFGDQPWRFLLSAASGRIHLAAIIVEQRFHKGGGQGNAYLKKSVVGVIDNPPPTNCVTWINDATATVAHVEAILGRPVLEATPQGQIERRKKAVQIPRDITRRTSAKTVRGLIRGVMADRPQFRRIGIIGHRTHMPVLKKLGTGFDERIVKTSYFGSGEERSSNDWHHKCDLIIVAGTPRISLAAIAKYLVQIGEMSAATCEPEWGVIYWHGETESQEPTKVNSRGYKNEAWRRAHQDLVRAQIVQATGRGRGILETGCEVLVLSDEECGLPLSDTGVEILNDASVAILNALSELTTENPNKYILGKPVVSTGQLAETTGLSRSRCRDLLRVLERRGLVQKIGERSGWRLVVYSAEEAAPCA